MPKCEKVVSLRYNSETVSCSLWAKQTETLADSLRDSPDHDRSSFVRAAVCRLSSVCFLDLDQPARRGAVSGIEHARLADRRPVRLRPLAVLNAINKLERFSPEPFAVI
jgi:hypothetical protein